MNWLIIGLGNPEEKYIHTRHNVGFLALDFLQTDWDYDTYAQSRISEMNSTKHHIILAQPQTYMNASGEVLDYFFSKKDCSAERMIIVYDDLDLPLGKIKISYDRGDGGHNGIKSLIAHAKTTLFIRIRIGISRDAGDGKVYKQPVLGNFTDTEKKVLSETVFPNVQKAIGMIIEKGYQYAMNHINTKSE